MTRLTTLSFFLFGLFQIIIRIVVEHPASPIKISHVRIYFTTLFLSLSFYLQGQFTLDGYITNTKGEKLDFAVIYLENTNYAAVTDPSGYYKIENIVPGDYTIKVSHTSYQSIINQININQNRSYHVVLDVLAYPLENIEIIANKLQKSDPFRFKDVSESYIEKYNLGLDIPALLQFQTSVLTTSDAGTGIGYSGLSIRGSDQTRINVTINGVPVNDAESQNVFWVNMPDLSGSVQSVQIQRGAGASTNGPGAFGGTLSFNTRDLNQNPYVSLSGSAGSFGTLKGSVGLGTGLMNGKYFMEGRYSYITSEGFIDRASANLNGIFFSAGRISEKSSLRFQVVSGREVTYQAWNGVPESKFSGDTRQLADHYNRNIGSIYKNSADSVNLFGSDPNTYNYYLYENQVDNYRQTQSQVSYNRQLSPKTSLQTTAFYTFGKGYFEQFRFDDALSDYGFNEIFDKEGNVITSTDLVRRRWLQNHFFGVTSNINGEINRNIEWQSGVFLSHYDGDHFGEIIKTWIEPATSVFSRYYDNTGRKTDISGFARISGDIQQKLQFFTDLQLRHVRYDVNGLLEDQIRSNVDESYLFFNPKAGITYALDKKSDILLSFAIANREPARSDFVDHIITEVQPKPETMFNYELAYRLNGQKLSLQTGLYFMDYTNQLVLNGNLNDVGAALRINVPESYRFGWESELTYQVHRKVTLMLNMTLSRNRIRNFSETIYDYTNGFEVIKKELGETPIAYSPNIISSLQCIYKPIKNFEVEWSGRYVGKQFLDNTGNENRKLPAFHVHNLRLSYEFLPKFAETLKFNLLVQNVLNRKYASNGYTYSYIFENTITENFVFPQAGIHFFAGFDVRF
jgi:iron complex outermembrane recepter protein